MASFLDLTDTGIMEGLAAGVTTTADDSDTVCFFRPLETVTDDSAVDTLVGPIGGTIGVLGGGGNVGGVSTGVMINLFNSDDNAFMDAATLTRSALNCLMELESFTVTASILVRIRPRSAVSAFLVLAGMATRVISQVVNLVAKIRPKMDTLRGPKIRDRPMAHVSTHASVHVSTHVSTHVRTHTLPSRFPGTSTSMSAQLVNPTGYLNQTPQSSPLMILFNVCIISLFFRQVL